MKRLYGVIGNPIAHSMSPAMHNDLFSYYGLEGHYLPFNITKENLETAVNGFKAMGIGGLNVTVPHKTTIIPYLDEIDPLAKAIGAVNTVVNDGGRLIGYNTDGRGYFKSVVHRLPSIQDKKVLLIGAGGAARAIYFSLAEAGVYNIDICNRTVSNAEELVAACPFSVNTSAFDLLTAESHLARYEMIIQTTSIGMSPRDQDSPLNLKGLKQGTFVSDIVYNPLKTKILRDAEDRGAIVQNGIDMFVYQGALAFENWTGIFPDTDRMRKNVLQQLGGQYVNR